MAWMKVIQTMSFRREIVNLANHPEANVREICRRFQVSPKTVYKWLKRFREQGEAGLANMSRRPHQSPRRTETRIETKILKMRARKPAWGARKIGRRLRDLKNADIPGDSTIHRILVRHGQLDPAESSKHQAYKRFEHEAPNQLWQMDFKGWFKTDDGKPCHPLTVLDDHSRYVVCLEACQNQQGETVQSKLIDTFRRYGMPERMTMDNGSPWGGDDGCGFTPLTAWLVRLGVAVSHSRPYHPQTQGKDERFHRTLQAELLRWHRFRNSGHVQRKFGPYRQAYNLERPHQAIGMNVPASRYRISNRTFPETLPPIEYDSSDIVRLVAIKGRIQYQGRRFKIGKAFQGYPVALRPSAEDGVLHVYFCHQRVKTIDMREGQ